MKILKPLAMLTTICALSTPSLTHAQTFQSPDVLILGDSQITFGAGPAYFDFFKNLTQSCRATGAKRQKLKTLTRNSVAVIGVRSTSLPDWSSKTSKGKTDICDVDPNLKRNAGAFGTVNLVRSKYVQIGQGSEFQFCKPNLSPIKAALQPDYYQPKLLVLSFLGNTTDRWAKSPNTARADVKRMLAEIPTGQSLSLIHI